ncbi:DUF4855 domain-containing protein [Paenibacillus sp. J2TS4]|uniref:DUF4855 domain-containing protein n=1 Tax=Paenibacillus sp. J2TS4 TaxID=2807194 RepID=UPI001B242868|nr:DUF4855 domain-containing protein [Paenibacillus sp. J2TS4]GIP35051.1 hypothetical protein J2TS4_42610 [Paenibacillus sp. J2TS4]
MKSNKWFSLLVAILMALTVVPAVGLSQSAIPDNENLMNLALGKSYTLETPYPRDPHFSNVEAAHKDEAGKKLTDGEYGGTTFSSGKYVGSIWQGSRIVTIDLEQISTVQDISVSVLQDLPVGIFFPKQVRYSISRNGKTWENLDTVHNEISTTETGPLTQKLTLRGINKVARYVKLEVAVDSWMFMDEIEIWGTPDRSGRPLTPSPQGPKDKIKYPQSGTEQTGGIGHEVLIYTGEWAYEPADWISFSKDDFKPYVSYVDADMNRVDYMFDSYLFLPYAPLMDGANFGPTAGKPTAKAHFESYLDRLFRDDYELGALNEAVKEAKAELGNPSYKAKVAIAIPYPRTDQNDFGDVDGDGISENMKVSEVGEEQALASRDKVVRWFVDEVYDRWEQAGYTDIELASFYWYNEFVAYQLSEMDGQLIRKAGDYVRSKGARLQWIPYYFGRGWDEWKDIGFDSALMQPNYMFHNTSAERVDAIAQAARAHGMGVEIEMSDAVLTDPAMRDKYYTYLDKGVQHGYMTGSYNAYYQQVKTLLQAAQSGDPDAREVYDRTYQFIKGQYKARR